MTPHVVRDRGFATSLAPERTASTTTPVPFEALLLRPATTIRSWCVPLPRPLSVLATFQRASGEYTRSLIHASQGFTREGSATAPAPDSESILR